MLRNLHQNGTNESVEAKAQPHRPCRSFAGGQAAVCSSTDQEGEERRGREILQLPYHASESQERAAKCFQLPSTVSPAAQRHMAHLSRCPTYTFHPAGDILGLGVPALGALSDGVPGNLAAWQSGLACCRKPLWPIDHSKCMCLTSSGSHMGPGANKRLAQV